MTVKMERYAANKKVLGIFLWIQDKDISLNIIHSYAGSRLYSIKGAPNNTVKTWSIPVAVKVANML